MRTFLTSVLVLALLAGTASAAVYSDNFDSYGVTTTMTGGLGTPSWEQTNNGAVEAVANPSGGGNAVMKSAAGSGLGYRGAHVNAAMQQPSETFARVQADVYKDSSTGWHNTQEMKVFLNGTNLPNLGGYNHQNLYKGGIGNYSPGLLMQCPGATNVAASGFQNDTWFTIVMTADYSTAGQIDFTVNMYAQGDVGGTALTSQAGTVTSGHTLVPAGGGGLIMTDGAGAVYMDNFELEFIPEPTTLAVLALMGGLTLLRRRRRKA